MTDRERILEYLRGGSVGNLDLSWGDLEKMFLNGANLTGANLRLADLKSADLTDAILKNANLTKFKK